MSFISYHTFEPIKKEHCIFVARLKYDSADKLRTLLGSTIGYIHSRGCEVCGLMISINSGQKKQGRVRHCGAITSWGYITGRGSTVRQADVAGRGGGGRTRARL